MSYRTRSHLEPAVLRFFVSFAAAALAAGALFAESPVPLTYSAITDRTVRSKPPAPALGPAGSVVVDPTFSSRILRVTDDKGFKDHPSMSFYTTAGAFVNAWNKDGTKFFIRCDAGFVLYSFDPAKFQAAFLGFLPLAGPWFSYQDPDIVYGLSGRFIAAYHISTQKTDEIVNLNTIVKDYPQYEYAISVSDDDNIFSIAFSGIQDTYRYAVVYNRSAATWTLLDLYTKTLSTSQGASGAVAGDCAVGDSSQAATRPGLHSSVMDRTGRFVSLGGPNVGGNGGCIWDVQSGVVNGRTAYWSGHDALGFGQAVNQSGIRIDNTSDARGFTLRALDDLNNHLEQLIAPPPPAPYSWNLDGHWSWSNAKAGVKPPVIGSFYRQNADDPNWELWDDEIVAVQTDGAASTVWRFAHHRSVYKGNFWDSPRGSVSQDGKWFVFTSNWDRTLGADPDNNGAPREDVFIVDLMTAGTVSPGAAAPPPANSGGGQTPPPASPPQPPANPPSPSSDTTPPVVSIIAPRDQTAIRGTVTVTANASDNAAVSKVEFYVDGALQFTAAGAPYAFTLQTAPVPDGQHTIAAKVYDAAGNTAMSTVKVTVDNTPPKVSITNPGYGALVSGSATVLGSATDNIGVTTVELYADGALMDTGVGSPFTLRLDGSLTAGGHVLEIRAYDAAGNSASATVPVNVGR